MGGTYKMVLECGNCGRDVEHHALDISDGDVPVVHMEFIGDENFECENCGANNFVNAPEITCEGGDEVDENGDVIETSDADA